jgi:hypothetical protein
LRANPVRRRNKLRAPGNLVIADKPWKGDFNQMIEQRMIRMLVPCGRTLY